MNDILFKPGILQNYLDFSIVILSLIVITDLLYKLKRPFQLKLCFLTISMTILLFSIFRLFVPINLYTIAAIGFIKLFFAIAIINMFTYIYFNNYRKLVHMISFIFMITTTGYLSYILMEQIPMGKFDHNNWGAFYFTIDIQSYSLNIPLILHIIRAFSSLITIGLIFYFCIQIIRNINYNNLYFKKLKIFTIAILFYFSLMVLVFISRIFIAQGVSFYNVLMMFFFQIFLLITILYRPEFLNRSGAKMHLLKELFKPDNFSIDKHMFSHLFFQQFYYKDKNANVADLAKLMMVSKMELTAYVQNDYGYTFDDLVNKHRIEYFIKLIKEPQYQNFTIEALAQESGFISRNSFYKPFKRFHGGNPSDLIEFNS